RWADVDRLTVRLPPGAEFREEGAFPQPDGVRVGRYDPGSRLVEYRLSRRGTPRDDRARPFTVYLEAAYPGAEAPPRPPPEGDTPGRRGRPVHRGPRGRRPGRGSPPGAPAGGDPRRGGPAGQPAPASAPGQPGGRRRGHRPRAGLRRAAPAPARGRRAPGLGGRPDRGPANRPRRPPPLGPPGPRGARGRPAP